MSASDDDSMPDLEDVQLNMPPVAAAAAAVLSSSPPSGLAATVNDSDSDDSDSDAWSEADDAPAPLALARCLFCSHDLCPAELVQHMTSQHKLDLSKLLTTHRLDCFGYIRLVNFVRSSGVTPDQLDRLPASCWADDRYMKPVVDSDPLLMLDVEDLAAAASQSDRPTLDGSDDHERGDDVSDAQHVVNYEGDHVTLSVTHYQQLQQQLVALRRQLLDGEQRAEQLVADMATMRGTMHHILQLDDEQETVGSAAAGAAARSAATVAGDGPSYFESYSHFGIHHEMLSDRVRTEAYRDAIQRNAAPVVRGQRVLDLGCGSGILSMLCARAGADHVVGVDMSDIVYSAMDIVRENSLSNTISMVKGRLEDVSLPGGPGRQFDVIVSEWMGYFLLFEGMLDTVLYARDRLLREGGTLMPNRCSLSLAAVSDAERYAQQVQFWSDVYGFRMSCLRSEVLQEASVEVVPAAAVCSESAQLLSLDISTATVADTEFTAPFSMRVTRACRVTALAGYFDTHFDLPVPVMFSTSPLSPPTHWKQTLFYLHQPITVAAGDTIDGSLFCSRDRKDVRSLRVTITIRGGKSHLYRVS